MLGTGMFDIPVKRLYGMKTYLGFPPLRPRIATCQAAGDVLSLHCHPEPEENLHRTWFRARGEGSGFRIQGLEFRV